MKRQTNGLMREAFKREAKSWPATVETLCGDIDVLEARVEVFERKLAWYSVPAGSCATCKYYSPGCGRPEDDGNCKIPFSRHATMLGVPDRKWAHVSEDDVCAKRCEP